MFVFVYIVWIYIYILFSFADEIGELTILITKHSLLAIYTTWKVCFLTTNFGHNKVICWATNRKIYFLTTDLRVMIICWATWKISFRTITLGHLPSPSYKTFFPDDTGFSYLLLKASRSKYMRLCRNHTRFLWIYCTWLNYRINQV